HYRQVLDGQAVFADELVVHTAFNAPTKAEFFTNSRRGETSELVARYIASFAVGGRLPPRQNSCRLH
ncbi:MAG: hypothetical protein ACOVN9_05815, partial [Inhella sp.]